MQAIHYVQMSYMQISTVIVFLILILCKTGYHGAIKCAHMSHADSSAQAQAQAQAQAGLPWQDPQLSSEVSLSLAGAYYD